MLSRSFVGTVATIIMIAFAGILPARAMPFHDVFVMLDNSGSLGQANFDAQKQAAINLVTDYGGNPNNPMRFSIIEFATNATLIHSLEDDPLNPGGAQDHSAVLATLNGLSFTGGYTDTPGALQLMLNESNLWSGFPNTTTAILFTDGQPYGPTGQLSVCQYENQIKANDIKVNIVGHGDGWVNQNGAQKTGCLVMDPSTDILSKPSPLQYDINDYAYLSSTLIAMPEPGMIAVLGLGFAFIGFTRRRAA